MKAWLPAFLLLAPPQSRPALPEALQSKHYDMKTSCTKEQGQELLDFMELVHQTYLALLKPGVIGGSIGTFDPDSVSNGGFSINGARADEYVVMVDGAVATRTRSSGSMLGLLRAMTALLQIGRK